MVSSRQAGRDPAPAGSGNENRRSQQNLGQANPGDQNTGSSKNWRRALVLSGWVGGYLPKWAVDSDRTQGKEGLAKSLKKIRTGRAIRNNHFLSWEFLADAIMAKVTRGQSVVAKRDQALSVLLDESTRQIHRPCHFSFDRCQRVRSFDRFKHDSVFAESVAGHLTYHGRRFLRLSCRLFSDFERRLGFPFPNEVAFDSSKSSSRKGRSSSLRIPANSPE